MSGNLAFQMPLKNIKMIVSQNMYVVGYQVMVFPTLLWWGGVWEVPALIAQGASYITKQKKKKVVHFEDFCPHFVIIVWHVCMCIL